MANHRQIAVVLPNRVGDALLSLPAVTALKLLQQQADGEQPKVTLYPPGFLHNLVTATRLYPTRRLTVWEKMHSWWAPFEKALFLSTTSQDMGLHAKTTYGGRLPTKWYCRFTVDMPYLLLDFTPHGLPHELLEGLQAQHHLSLAAIRYFGMCLALGYTPAQILEAFTLTPLLQPDILAHLHAFKPRSLLPAPYLVCCMEAGYGSKGASDRCWNPEAFVTLAEQAYQAHQLNTVFVGLETQWAIPSRPYLQDMRRRFSLDQLAHVLSQAVGYIGNDSGILHLANFLQIPTVGIYLATHPEVYGPIFGQLNHPLINPGTVDAVWPTLNRFIEESLAHHPTQSSVLL